METANSLLPAPAGWDFQVYPLTFGTLMGLFVVLLLLLFSAFISGSEVAYFSLSPNDKQKLRNSKNKISNSVLKNLENPEKLLATILVANNFVNVGIIILSAYITSHLFNFSNAPVVEFIFQVIIITFFLLLFGEIIPKVYATYYGLGFARFMAIPLAILEKIFSPINNLLIYSTSFVNKRLHKHKNTLSIEVISQAMELTSEQELSEEKEILEGIVKFGNKCAADIMRPRVDVTAIDIKTKFGEVLKIIKDCGYSRIPVFSESFDQISGILYIKDLLPHVHKGNTFKWQSTIRPPFYVPETKKINKLLDEFRKRKVHLAIVVDEYGGSSGIVTLEDIIEEIVGEITDEFDEEELLYTKITDNKFLFNGKIQLPDFYKVVGCNDTLFDDVKGDADTLAGLILELKGDIPALHEKISCKGFTFHIEAVNNRRIEQIKVETK
ncbi:Hemolysins and related proteins containing CBS domains [hydrothermal vent metagenome]|uniref:Hemolysins and related proteins containing CBS domains n=1 Tax=hydrothermal vent metagenome TaxID=652676 RepID=A0A3B0T8M2_9ZZZZ